MLHVRSTDAEVRQAADQAAAPTPKEAARLTVPRSATGRDAAGAVRQPPRRIYLTYKYRGISSVLFRTLIFPSAVDPAGPGAAARPRAGKRRGRRAAVVQAPRASGHDRDPQLPGREAGGAAGREDPDRRPTEIASQIIVADDASGAEHVAALRQIDGIEVVPGEHNAGFAANVNRGLASRRACATMSCCSTPTWSHCATGWRASSTRPRAAPNIGIVGAKLLYPDNRIQYGGTIRNPAAPEWFDHRYRFKPADWGPANIAGPTLAATGACMYIRARRPRSAWGCSTRSTGWAMRTSTTACVPGRRVTRCVYAPSARLHHHESLTRGTAVGERERKSQRVFWRRWGTFFDERPVLNDDGRLRVVYVAQDTNVFGGHPSRIRASQRPHRARPRRPAVDAGRRARLVRAALPGAELRRLRRARRGARRRCTRSRSRPGGRPPPRCGAQASSTVCRSTSFRTSRPAITPKSPCAERGAGQLSARVQVPHHLDLESSSTWRSWGLDADVDFAWDRTSTPSARCQRIARRDDMLLALGRSNPLKNLRLTLAAWRRLPEPRARAVPVRDAAQSWRGSPASVTSRPRPTRRSTSLLNQATAFLQTSTHEGFCLTILEAMAAGCPWSAPMRTATVTSAWMERTA